MSGQTPGIEWHFNGQLGAVKNPDDVKAWSCVWPLHNLKQFPDRRILVITSSTPLAVHYCLLTRKLIAEGCGSEDILPAETRTEIRTKQDGYIYYARINSAICGRNFNFIILSDPEGKYRGGSKHVLEYINDLRARLEVVESC